MGFSAVRLLLRLSYGQETKTGETVTLHHYVTVVKLSTPLLDPRQKSQMELLQETFGQHSALGIDLTKMPGE